MDLHESPGLIWKRRCVLLVIAIAALVIRLYYIHNAVVESPIRGDVNQYYSYAWNLIHHHTFSMALPNAENAAPDGFRDPGYPMFLAAVGAFTGTDYALYSTVLLLQSVLGAATVWIFAALAHRWIGMAAAVGVGIALALWPHGISLSGTMLGETFLGFMVALALLATDEMMARKSTGAAVLAGLAFSLASLTSSVVLPFAPLAGAWMALRDRGLRKLWMIFLACCLSPLIGWAGRSASLPAGQTSSERAAVNFVQGSWPEYHPSYLPYLAGQPWAAENMAEIEAETDAFRTSPVCGMGTIIGRLKQNPWKYMAWYLSKPLELWGWSIGIGQEDIYVFPTTNSPLTVPGLLAVTTNACFLLNPFVMLLAAIGSLACLSTKTGGAAGLRLAACLAFFVTAVYTILQADARYATPFRGIQLCLAAFALKIAVQKVRQIGKRQTRAKNRRNASQTDAQ